MISNEDKLVCPLSVKDEPPWVDGTKFLCNGHVIDYEDNTKECFSPITRSSHEKRTSIGSVLQMDEPMIEETLRKARCTWNEGSGAWPTAGITERVARVRRILQALQTKRDEIIRIILWDTCKTLKEANQEFNHTIQFAESTIQNYEKISANQHPAAPIGLVLCWGAEVNSFEETYRILIPALITGNVLIVKVPCIGGLVHILTMGAFTENLPNNTVQFVVGAINVVAEPLMSSGEIDMLALAGARSLADKLILAHPSPHRLKLLLHLDSETLAVILPDADLSSTASEITKAVRHCRSHTSGLKLVLAHTSVVQPFLKELCSSIHLLKCGLPWTKDVDITPVPGHNQPERLQELLIDALQKGAMLVNCEDGGGHLLPEFHGTIMKPAVVYPINDTMQLWRVRVTGPIVAVASYTHIDEVSAYITHSSPDVHASVFTAHPTRADLPALLNEPPHQIGVITFNRVCLEQHVAGYGTLHTGLNEEEPSEDPTQVLSSFLSQPVLRGLSHSHPVHIATSEVPFNATGDKSGGVESSAHSSGESCLDMPGPLPSPIGVAHCTPKISKDSANRITSEKFHVF